MAKITKVGEEEERCVLERITVTFEYLLSMSHFPSYYEFMGNTNKIIKGSSHGLNIGT